MRLTEKIMQLRHYAPAGTPISLRELAAWGAEQALGRDRLGELRQALCRRFGIAHCAFVSSGRAAMYLILRSLAERRPARDEVVVPAYTCYSVAASAVRAGLKIRVCDIDPSTLSYDLDALRKLDYRRVLAVVSANLYGIPDPLAQIEACAREHGVHMIDDAAQAMGARTAGRYCGSFGDLGVYSLDKGKNITSMQGGMIVTQSPELARLMTGRIAALAATPPLRTLSHAAQLVAYSVLLRPSLYWIPERLLELGATAYTTDYPVQRYSAALAGIPWRLFLRLDELQARRRRNAETLTEALSELAGVTTVALDEHDQPVYARLPVLLRAEQRDEVRRELLAAGIGASGSYPLALQDVPELAPHLRSAAEAARGGREVARRILTLPTHPYVGAAQIATVVRRTRSALSQGNSRYAVRNA